MDLVVAAIGVLLAVSGVVFWIVQKQRGKHINGYKVLAVLGLAIFIIGNSFSIIPTGEVGVRTTFGQISDHTVSNGINLKAPFIQSIKTVNVKQQDISIASNTVSIDAAAKGKIPITVGDVKVTYQINADRAAWIQANISDSSNLVDFNIVSSAIKDVTINYDVNEVTVRSVLEGAAAETLQKYINNKYGENTVTIIQVIVGSINFEDSYNDSVNKKNIAQQDYEAAQTKNKEELEKAEREAKVQETKAEGDAKATRIRAEAEAEANKKLSESLNSAILANNWIVKWDGKQPLVTDANGSIIDISGLIEGNTASNKAESK